MALQQTEQLEHSRGTHLEPNLEPRIDGWTTGVEQQEGILSTSWPSWIRAGSFVCPVPQDHLLVPSVPWLHLSLFTTDSRDPHRAILQQESEDPVTCSVVLRNFSRLPNFFRIWDPNPVVLTTG